MHAQKYTAERGVVHCVPQASEVAGDERADCADLGGYGDGGVVGVA